MFEGLFNKNKQSDKTKVSLPEAMQQEDLINYNSVLDYLVGLSDKDYRKMTASSDIYRKANKEVAKVIGVKDEPTTSIAQKPIVTDADLDNMLDADKDDLVAAFIDEAPISPPPKKAQATEHKVGTKD